MRRPLANAALTSATLALGIASAVGAQPTADLTGRWSGFVSFRGSSWPVALEIDLEAGQPHALLDLPELEYWGEPAPASFDDGLVVTFPFGLGGVSLAPREGPSGDSLVGSRELGSGSTIVVELERASTPTPFTAHEVSFTGADTILAGTLLVPLGDGPFPGVAFVHGAATGSRDSWAYRRLSHRLAASGVAVLLYDRRGEGASRAGPADTGFRHLAGDALAAVRVLREHPRIDPRRVGLSGGSQGGWVSALAATMSSDVAFVVLRVTPARMPSQAELDHAEWAMRADDRSHEDVQAALAHLRQYFAYVATGEGWELLAASSARAAVADWGRYVDQPERPEQLDWWRSHHAFDTFGVITRLRVPVLVVFGANDPVAPPALNSGLMRRALEETGVEHVVEVIPDAGHSLELPGMLVDEETGTWVWPRYSPRARELIVGWIQGQGPRGE